MDYLTLLTPSERNQKRHEQVAQLAKDLKAVARELNVPVLALAQLNREMDKFGKESRPRLSNLRESGDIEQTADQVLLLYRPRKKIEHKENGVVVDSWDADLEYAKNRKGATPTFKLDWDEDGRSTPNIPPATTWRARTNLPATSKRSNQTGEFRAVTRTP